jgi:hypothetical protein
MVQFWALRRLEKVVEALVFSVVHCLGCTQKVGRTRAQKVLVKGDHARDLKPKASGKASMVLKSAAAAGFVVHSTSKSRRNVFHDDWR